MKRHELDTVAFGFGAVFGTFVVVWLGSRLIEVDLPPAGWILAVALIVFGVIGIVSTLVPYLNQTGAVPVPGDPDLKTRP